MDDRERLAEIIMEEWLEQYPRSRKAAFQAADRILLLTQEPASEEGKKCVLCGEDPGWSTRRGDLHLCEKHEPSTSEGERGKALYSTTLRRARNAKARCSKCWIAWTSAIAELERMSLALLSSPGEQHARPMSKDEAEWLRSMGCDPDDCLISEAQVRQGKYMLAEDFFNQLRAGSSPGEQGERIGYIEESEIGVQGRVTLHREPNPSRVPVFIRPTKEN